MSDERNLSDLIVHITDPERNRLALEWLTTVGRQAKEWNVVKNGGMANSEFLKEIPQEEFHAVTSFGVLVGTGIDQIAAYNQARELAEKQGKPELMDAYVHLILADEVMTRLRDGRLFLGDIHTENGPVLVIPDALTNWIKRKRVWKE